MCVEKAGPCDTQPRIACEAFSVGLSDGWFAVLGFEPRSSWFMCWSLPHQGHLVSIAREPVVYLNLAVVHSSAFVSRRGHIPCNYSIKIPVPAAVVEPPTSFYNIYLPVLNAPGTRKRYHYWSLQTQNCTLDPMSTSPPHPNPPMGSGKPHNQTRGTRNRSHVPFHCVLWFLVREAIQQLYIRYI